MKPVSLALSNAVRHQNRPETRFPDTTKGLPLVHAKLEQDGGGVTPHNIADTVEQAPLTPSPPRFGDMHQLLRRSHHVHRPAEAQPGAGLER